MGLFGKSKEKKSEELYEKGGKLISQEKYEESISCFDEAFKINPEFFEALLRKGLTLGFQLKRYDEAISCFDEVIRLKPQHDWAWNYKSRALKELGRNEEAEFCLNKSKELEEADKQKDALEVKTIVFRSLNELDILDEELHQMFDGKTITGNYDATQHIIRKGITPISKQNYELLDISIEPPPITSPQDYYVTSNSNINIE